MERSRKIDGKASIERSEFLCSLTNQEKFSREVRGHWGIGTKRAIANDQHRQQLLMGTTECDFSEGFIQIIDLSICHCGEL